MFIPPPEPLKDESILRIVKTLNGYHVEKRIEYEVRESQRTFLWGLLRGDISYRKDYSWYPLDETGDIAQRFMKNTKPAEFLDLEEAEEFFRRMIEVGKVIKTHP